MSKKPNPSSLPGLSGLNEMRSKAEARTLEESTRRKKLAEFLRLSRIQLGLTQRQAGNLAKPAIDAGFISKVECSGFAGRTFLSRYASILGCVIPSELIPTKNNSRRMKTKNGKVPTARLGKFLRDRRKALGLSQTDIAKALGAHWSPICRWETGKQTIPDAYLDDWALALKCNPADLRTIADPEADIVSRVVLLRREDSEFLDFLLHLSRQPDSSKTVRDSCKFIYNYLLGKTFNPSFTQKSK